MGSYNTVDIGIVTCPRCGADTQAEVDFEYGWLDNIVYHVGDKVITKDNINTPREYVGDGKEAHNIDGYTVCEKCKKDFWLNIRIEADRIVDFEVDTKRKGYIPD